MLSRKLFAVPSRIWTASIGRVGVGVTAGKLNQVKLGFLNGRIITGCWLVDYLKPRNCAWSMEARMSLSTGVSWGFSMVKAESKYWTSRIWRCTAQERKTTPSINRYSESFVVRFICLKINQSIIHDIVSYFKTQCGKIAVEDWRYLRLWVWRAVQYLCVRVAPSWCSWRRDGRRFRQRCNPAFPAASEDLSPTTENRRKGIISGTRAFLSHNILAERKKWETEMKSGSYQDENGLCLFGEEARVISLFVTDTPEEFIFIAAVEWRLSYHHFVEEDAERPPIHTLVILQTFDNLDSQM